MSRLYKSYPTSTPVEYNAPKRTELRGDAYELTWSDDSGDFMIGVEAYPRKWYQVYVQITTADGTKVVYDEEVKTKKEAMELVRWLKGRRWDV